MLERQGVLKLVAETLNHLARRFTSARHRDGQRLPVQVSRSHRRHVRGTPPKIKISHHVCTTFSILRLPSVVMISGKGRVAGS